MTEPATTAPVWAWLGYQYRALPELLRVALMAVVLTGLQAVLASNMATINDWNAWLRSLGAAMALSGANAIWAAITPGTIASWK